jgi:pseudaminic acid cytidylyltransferase
MRALCVIPARAGSKRIKSKNIMPFLGRPIISYSLDAASDARVFSEIHVSTESEEISTVVGELGYPVSFFRDASLADDHTPLVPVLRWVLSAFKDRGAEFDSVCLLMSCAPLVLPEDIKNAYKLFEDNGSAHAVLSVAQFRAPAEWAYHRDDTGFIVPREPETLSLRSQDLEASYYDTGTFAIFPVAQILDESYQGGGQMLSYVLPEWRAVDIDSEEDVVLAEILAQGIHARLQSQTFTDSAVPAPDVPKQV